MRRIKCSHERPNERIECMSYHYDYLSPPTCLHAIVLFFSALLTQPSFAWSDREHIHNQSDQPSVWSAAQKAYIPPNDLVEAFEEADVILIGEVHDNPWHHEAQAWLLSQLPGNRKPPIIFEMIGAAQSSALEKYLSGENANAAELGPAIGWEKRGWPKWSMYAPIAKFALEKGQRIVAGDAARKDLTAVGRGSLQVLEEDVRETLNLNEPLAAQLQASLIDELRESHCNLLPKAALLPMSAVQRFRDATMAAAIARNFGHDGAILIAGNGHVRRDRGVAWYLRRHLPEARILTIGLSEADADQLHSLGGKSQPPEPNLETDFNWLLPRQHREDQCELLRKRMSKPMKRPED